MQLPVYRQEAPCPHTCHAPVIWQTCRVINSQCVYMGADINNILKARQQFMQQQTENDIVKEVRAWASSVSQYHAQCTALHALVSDSKPWLCRSWTW